MPCVWLQRAVVLALHDEQLAEHGGAPGLRDEALLDSALARPQNLLAHSGPEPGVSALAAAYAYGLARNHPFIDGNKRTSPVVAETFLLLNGAEMEADDGAIVMTWLRLAEGSISEEELAAWIEERLVSST